MNAFKNIFIAIPTIIALCICSPLPSFSIGKKGKSSLSTPMNSTPSSLNGNTTKPKKTSSTSQKQSILATGYCCRNGLLNKRKITRLACDQEKGTFFTSSIDARKYCGFCCKSGTISSVNTARAKSECVKGGKFYKRKSLADENCGWCCRNQKLFTVTDTKQCAHIGDSFFNEKAVARKKCQPITGYCSSHGRVVSQITRKKCDRLQGLFFTKLALAKADLIERKNKGLSKKLSKAVKQETKKATLALKSKKRSLLPDKTIQKKARKGAAKGTDYGISFITPVWGQNIHPSETIVVRYTATRPTTTDNFIFTVVYTDTSSSRYPWERTISVPNDPSLAVGESGWFEFTFPDDTPLGQYWILADQGTSTLLGATDPFRVVDYHTKQIHFSHPRAGEGGISGRDLTVSCWSDERVEPGEINLSLYAAGDRRALLTTTLRHTPRSGSTGELRFSINWPIPGEISCGSCYIQATLYGATRSASGTSSPFAIEEPPERDAELPAMEAHPVTPLRIIIDGEGRVYHPGETIRAYVDIVGADDLPGFYTPDAYRAGVGGGTMYFHAIDERRGMGMWIMGGNIVSRSEDMRRLTVDFRLPGPENHVYAEAGTDEFVLRFVHEGHTGRSASFHVQP